MHSKCSGIGKYLVITAAGATLGLTGCDLDHELSDCCEELSCSSGCIDIASDNSGYHNLKDYCVKDRQGKYSKCCHCEEPEPNTSMWDK